MTTEFDEVLEQAFAALDRVARGDPSGYKALYSRRDDITVANPFGGVGRGWDEVVERLDRAASVYTDGRATGFEIVTQAVTRNSPTPSPSSASRRRWVGDPTLRR